MVLRPVPVAGVGSPAVSDVTTPQLAVEPLDDGRWRVTGGSAPHVVELFAGEGLRCDCKSFRFRGRCRHVDAVNQVEGSDAPDAGASADRGAGGPGLERNVPPPEHSP
jgi:hypothetical protein